MIIYIQGMYGLGDNIFQRPFVRAACDRGGTVFLKTSWPEVYPDWHNLRFVKPETNLRTQKKNIMKQPGVRWSAPPSGFTHSITLRYTPADFGRGNIVQAIERALPLAGTPFTFDLPSYPAPLNAYGADIKKPYAVVRPSTLRSEWKSDSRAPRPEYLQQAINILKQKGYTVVTVADVDGTNEWFDGPPPWGMDFAFHRGELDVTQVMGLVQHADICVGGVGFLVPMTIAAGVPLYIIFGGRGAHNAFDKITDSRMNLAKVGYSLPDRFCMCDLATHACDKHITNFAFHFGKWIDESVLGRREGLRLLSG